MAITCRRMGAGACLALCVAGAPQARADELADRLLAAAKADQDPADRPRECATFEQMHIDVGLANNPAGEWRVPAAEGASLPPDTRGALLGDGRHGWAVPPFFQALMDAGEARRLALVSIPSPGGAAPARALIDLGAQASADASGRAEPRNDLYVVTGPDRVMFPHQQPFGYITAPAMMEDEHAPPASGAPPVFWTTRSACVRLVPDRVLEYSDVKEIGNGFRQVAAAILLRAERLPSWIADPRVIEGLRPNLRPWVVRSAAFRDDGGGWREMPGSSASLELMTHLGSAPP